MSEKAKLKPSWSESNRNPWMNEPRNFEQMRQNFTTALCIHGPNMSLPEMSERLVEFRDALQAERAAHAQAMEILSSISSYLGHGLGDGNTTAEQFHDRIMQGLLFSADAHIRHVARIKADIAIPTATLERWAEAIRAANYWNHMLDEKNEAPDPVETEISAIIAQREKME
jgi:hypothetical protein